MVYARHASLLPQWAARSQYAPIRRKVAFSGCNSRLQIDYLRNPDANRAIETRAVTRAQDIQRTAVRIKEERDYNIHRRMKPQVSVMDITEEIGKNTIDKLRAEIKKKIDAKESEVKLLLKKAEIAHEIFISIPVSDMGELNRLKARADKEL